MPTWLLLLEISTFCGSLRPPSSSVFVPLLVFHGLLDTISRSLFFFMFLCLCMISCSSFCFSWSSYFGINTISRSLFVCAFVWLLFLMVFIFRYWHNVKVLVCLCLFVHLCLFVFACVFVWWLESVFKGWSIEKVAKWLVLCLLFLWSESKKRLEWH